MSNAQSKPPLTLLPELDRLLSARPALLADAIRRVVKDVRPCVTLRTTRLTGVPLRGSLVDRLLARPLPPAVLPPTASKFGGTPYVEAESELKGGRFLGQINFSEAAGALQKAGSTLPAGMPASGLMAIDCVPGHFAARVRWYPDPSQNKAVCPAKVECVAKYEARIDFAAGWSLRGLEWFDAVPSEDEELWSYMNELEIPGIDADARGGHKLFGHANEALNDHYGEALAPGRSSSIRDYELIWRIDYDRAAGFAFGTNWLYAVIHRDDLQRGAFDRAVVTAANA